MHDPSPELVGRLTAEALVQSLEHLKGRLGGDGQGSLEDQVRAGQVAVAAMKQLLGDVVEEMTPRD